MPFIIYIALTLIIMGITLALNWKYRWIDKNWIEENGELFALIALAVVFWPIGLLCLIVGLIFTAIHKYLIP